MTIKKIDHCLACKSIDIQEVLALTATPLTDSYQLSGTEAVAMEKYPLSPRLCLRCGHLQLAHQVSPEKSYNNYLYNSKITTGLPDNFRKYARDITTNQALDILDIGSNDGSFIAACLEQGHNAYGIEPSSALTDAANKIGRSTTNGYFEIQTVQRLCKKHGVSSFDKITFNNVLANIPSPKTALKLASTLLKNEDSEIYVQTGYHPTQFNKGLFDYIYHEHYSYFTISSMGKLAEQCNLTLVKADKFDLRGGSIRFCMKALKGDQERVGYSNIHERFKSIEDFKSLEALVIASKQRLSEQLNYYKSLGYLIVAFGASHSTGTLIHHFDIVKDVDYLIDENVLKHGKYMPGTKLKVHKPNEVLKNKNTAVIVLAWQYYEQIASKLRMGGFSGPIIKPVIP